MNTSGPEPENTCFRLALTVSAFRPFTSWVNRARSWAGLVTTSSSSRVWTISLASCGVLRVGAWAAAVCSSTRHSEISRSSSAWVTPYWTMRRTSASAAVRAGFHLPGWAET